jgi:hypothetical protein
MNPFVSNLKLVNPTGIVTAEKAMFNRSVIDTVTMVLRVLI